MWVRSYKLTTLGILTVIMLTGVLAHASSAVEIANYSPDLDISLTSDFLWRFVRDVQYSDGLIYLLMARGIRVYDGDVDFISPRLLSQFSLDDSYFSLDVDGAMAALCSGTGRLTFLDISDPEDIRVVSSVELGDTIFDYASNGMTALKPNLLAYSFKPPSRWQPTKNTCTRQTISMDSLPTASRIP